VIPTNILLKELVLVLRADLAMILLTIVSMKLTVLITAIKKFTLGFCQPLVTLPDPLCHQTKIKLALSNPANLDKFLIPITPIIAFIALPVVHPAELLVLLARLDMLEVLELLISMNGGMNCLKLQEILQVDVAVTAWLMDGD